VRACEAMFKRFFYEYDSEIYQEQKEKFDKHEYHKILFTYPDDIFISELLKFSIATSNMKLKDLIDPFAYEGRGKLYKAVYIFANNKKYPSVLIISFKTI